LTTVFKYKANNTHGFTLLEVMISVSIIAVVFVSLFRMQSGTIGLATAGNFNNLAPILAKKILSQVELDVVNFSETEGDFGEDYPGIQWQCEIEDSILESEEFVSEDSTYGLKKIDITIIGSSDSGTYRVSTWRVFSEE